VALGVRPDRAEADVKGLVALLDDPLDFTVEQWRLRNLRLYDELVHLGHLDPALVSREAHGFLTGALVHRDNPAARDRQNAGHIRAQNENILHYGLSAGVDRGAVTIALAAGFIHDLNKAVGEPLRGDRFAVHRRDGSRVEAQHSVALSVGLNHLGERTRRAIEDATRLEVGPLEPSTAAAIDHCIVHHGLGSSRFVRLLVRGRNAWWGEEFADPVSGIPTLRLPTQPPATLASVIHDLADSTQQMQGGVAWLHKYPFGFWRESGRSLAALLSEPGPLAAEQIPMSLRQQLEEETDTCRDIVLDGHRGGLFGDAVARALEAAILTAVRPSRRWVDDDPDYLAQPDGESVYHHLAADWGVPTTEARARLGRLRPDSDEGAGCEAALVRSARRVDVARTRALAELIAGRAHTTPPTAPPRASSAPSRIE
jgi:hypothetical protein